MYISNKKGLATCSYQEEETLQGIRLEGLQLALAIIASIDCGV